MSILKKSIIASAALALPLAVSANSKIERMMKDPSLANGYNSLVITLDIVTLLWIRSTKVTLVA